MRPSLVALISAMVGLYAIDPAPALAHPGSAIAVDQRGQVYFTNPGYGLLKIDSRGKLSTIHQEGGHWLALDPSGSFSRMEFKRSAHWPRWFKRRTPAGVRPALITDGGSPLVVHPDGGLYYVCTDEQMIPGGLQIARLSPDGKLKLLAPRLRETADRLGGIKGLACGPDGSLYATCPGAILKIQRDGTFSTLIQPVVVNDCDRHLPTNTPNSHEPYLTGLAVASNGTIYAAATGCRRVVKITPDGRVTTILKAERPWSPTGVALHGGDVYVLEHTNPNGEIHQWRPRVRKLGRAGKVTLLAAVTARA